MKSLICGLMVLVASICNFAIAQDGPFGLQWGDTAQELREKGLTLSDTKRDGLFSIYRTTSMPKNISIAESYSMIIHDRFGLQKVSVISKNIENDPTGREGKQIYNEFKSAISEKYGAASTSIERTGAKLYQEFDEFYQCLNHSGCGYWTSVWDLKDKGTIGIYLKGLSRAKGYIVITYEGPQWSRAVDEARGQKSTNDRKAL